MEKRKSRTKKKLTESDEEWTFRCWKANERISQEASDMYDTEMGKIQRKISKLEDEATELLIKKTQYKKEKMTEWNKRNPEPKGGKK